MKLDGFSGDLEEKHKTIANGEWSLHSILFYSILLSGYGYGYKSKLVEWKCKIDFGEENYNLAFSFLFFYAFFFRKQEFWKTNNKFHMEEGACKCKKVELRLN